MIYRIPVQSECIRTLKDPLGDVKRRTVQALIRLADLPNLPLNPDPRVPKERGPITRTIMSSAKTNDGNFHNKNRGIAICAKSVEYKSDEGIIYLDIPDQEDVYGIIDGGHTHFAIRKVINTLQESGIKNENILENQFVRLEILIGVENDLAEIARARNYSASLQNWGLEAYQGKFDWLLKALGSKTQYMLIRENEDKPYPIMDAIQVLCAMNPILFKKDTPALEAYKNAGKCLSDFVADGDLYGFQKFAPIALTVLKLYDYVRFHWAQMYNAPDEEGKHRRIGGRSEMDRRKRGRDRLLSFYFLDDSEIKMKDGFPVEKGYAIPLISIFRILLQDNGTYYSWKYDPFDFFDKHGAKLVKRVMDASSELGGEANYVGRDRATYQSLYQLAENAMLTLELERLREQMRKVADS